MKSGFIINSFHNLLSPTLAMQASDYAKASTDTVGDFERPAGLISFFKTTLGIFGFFIESVIECNPSMLPVVFIKNEGQR